MPSDFPSMNVHEFTAIRIVHQDGVNMLIIILLLFNINKWKGKLF